MTPPWLQELLQNPQLTDLCINGYRDVFADLGKGFEPLSQKLNHPLWLSEDELRNWVLHQLSLAGKTWDARHPFADATLPSGHRLHVAFPPLSHPGILVSIRRLGSSSQASKGDPRVRWKQSLGYYNILKLAVTQGETVLISGATGSGKTTLANDLLGEVSARERILILEDTPELFPPHPHFVRLVSRPPNPDGFGEVTLRTLMKQALRMRPDRLILGECRGEEVFELLQALNTGHRGTLTTLHSNSPRDALRRIELLCALHSSQSLPIGSLRELIVSGVQWIAQVDGTSKPERMIRELCRVEGREGDTILLRPMVQPST